MTQPAGPQPAPATTIDRLVDGVYPAMALLAAMQLDLFSMMDAGADEPASIAAAAGTDVHRTQLLLDGLVAAGLLTKVHGRFLLTAESRDHLTRSSPWSRIEGHQVLSTLWEAAANTARSLRAGAPAARHDYDTLSTADAVAFLRGLNPGAASLANTLVDRLDLRAGDRLVDIGGGGGGAAGAFLSAVPTLTVTVLELANMAPATAILLAEAGLDDRINVLAADATVEVPGSYDAAWISLVAQTLSPTDAESLIANTAAALSPNGAIHLVNVVVDPQRHSPPRAALFNLALLNLYDGGQTHSTADYERWLRAAGYGQLTWHPLNDMVRLVSARRH